MRPRPNRERPRARPRRDRRRRPRVPRPRWWRAGIASADRLADAQRRPASAGRFPQPGGEEMRRHAAGSLIFGVAAILLGSCAAAPQKPTVDVAAVKAALAEINQKYTAAVAAHDANALMPLYADDARMLPANAPRTDGHDGIRKTWERFVATPRLELTFNSSDITVTEAGEMAYDVGAYKLKFTDPKGKPVEDVGKYVTIFKKVGDEWKISVE